MKKFKRFLCGTLACVSASMATACGINGNESVAESYVNPTIAEFSLPNYDLSEHIITFADFPPQPNADSLQLYKDCGFNTYFMDLGYVSHDPALGAESDYFKKIKEVDDMGMDVLIHTMSNFYDGVDFSQFDNIVGFVATDEPPKSKFEWLANDCVSWINKGMQDYLYYVNLFPSYAGSSLGTAIGGGKTAFENYIDDYYDMVLSKVEGKKQIGFDHYPLLKRSEDYFLSDTYLYDLMTVAQKAKKENIDKFSTCIQSFKNGDIRFIESTSEITFQLYTAMAFGVNIFEFFCYLSRSGYTAMIHEGQQTDTWYAVQEALAEINLFDEVYLNFKWDGVQTFFGSENDKNHNTSHFDYIKKNTIDLPKIKKAACTQDTIIGGLKDQFGNSGYVVVNYTDPMHYKFDTVEIEFEKAKNVVVYKNGVETKYAINGNKLLLNLMPGEGVFVIVLED